MAVKVGINGFGRIGRQVLKAMKDCYPGELDIVAFNDLGDLQTMAHLFRYDSNYGHFKGTVEVADNKVNFKRPTDQIRHRALHGLYRALVANMVGGVTNGYKKELELVGVGYKASAQGNLLDLSLGFSHNIIFEIPKELKVTAGQEKGENPKVVLEGIDKQLLGQVAAKLRSLRKPEPYKGKGVKYKGEHIRRKAGKAAGK
jgi:large subunit ribosomal protein L6